MTASRRTHLIPRTLIFATVAALLLLDGCVSTLSQTMYVLSAEKRTSLALAGTQLYRHATLNSNPLTEQDLIVPGDGAVLVLSGSFSLSAHRAEALGLDEIRRIRLCLPLTTELRPDSLIVTREYLLQLLGDYTKTPEQARYTGTSGFVVIDSIPGKFLFAHLSAAFVNPAGEALSFEGDFAARVSK